jgi:hypothetical protein
MNWKRDCFERGSSCPGSGWWVRVPMLGRVEQSILTRLIGRGARSRGCERPVRGERCGKWRLMRPWVAPHQGLNEPRPDELPHFLTDLDEPHIRDEFARLPFAAFRQ